MQIPGALCVAALCFLMVFPGSTTLADEADSVCRVQKNAAGFRLLTWPPRSRVRVFSLSTHFKESEIAYLRRALENWNSVSKASRTQVQFLYEGSVATAENCDGCVTLMRGRIARDNHAALLDAVAFAETRIITYAKIILDQNLNDADEISNAVAHEIGHGFGLLDCYSCGQNSTVMNAVNASRGTSLPTACDVSQVKRVYELLNRQAQVRELNRRAQMDEGEEPVEDDTPNINQPLPNRPR